MKKTALAAALMLVAGSAIAAPVSTGGVFNMYSQAGLDTSGTMPGAILVNVDATISGFVDQAAGTWGVSSTTAFFGLNWTASGGQLYTAAGTYNMDTVSGVVSSAASCTVANNGNMCFTVGANQIAGSVNFAWGATTGIRVVNVWNVNANGSLTAAVVPGMENGPFPGYNAAFNLSGAGLYNAVPVPAAVWLFGSGLLGLAGVARRRKAA